MEKGTVYVTDRRVKQTINSIETLLGKLKIHNLVAVKELAGVTGQIVSMQPAVGKIVQLKSREMFSCINSRASWEAPVIVSNKAKAELGFWRSQIGVLNGIPIQESLEYAYSVYTDASGDRIWRIYS